MTIDPGSRDGIALHIRERFHIESAESERRSQSEQATATATATSPLDSRSQSQHSIWFATCERFAKYAFNLAIQQWLLFGVIIVITIASQVQTPATQQNVKSEAVAYLCVALIFLITGCTLSIHEFRESISRWKVHLFVQIQCFLVTSAIVFGITSLLAMRRSLLSPGLLIGMITMGCMATTISSNVVMTLQARGNSALTVAQTTIGNLIGAIVSPALVVMYTSTPTWYNKAIPVGGIRWSAMYGRVLQRLGLSLYLPLCVGLLLQWHAPLACKTVLKDWQLGKVGGACLLVLLWQTLDTAFAMGAFQDIPAESVAILILLGIGFYCFFQAYTIASSMLWLNRRDVVAVSYCVTAKGLAVGVPLANAIFADADNQLRAVILIPLAVYQCIQLVGGAILVMPFKHWVTKAEGRHLGDLSGLDDRERRMTSLQGQEEATRE